MLHSAVAHFAEPYIEECNLNLFGTGQLGTQNTLKFCNHLVVWNTSASFIPTNYRVSHSFTERLPSNALINDLSRLVQLLRELLLRPALGLPSLLDGNSEIVPDLRYYS
jgi:hypothetical protein